MNEQAPTKPQLITELDILRQKVAHLEAAAAEGKQTEEALRDEIVRRRLAEVELQRREAQVDQIANNIPGVVFQVLVKRNGSLEILYLSEQSYALSGLRAQDLQANPALIFEVFSEESIAQVQRQIEAQQGNGAKALRGYHMELQLSRPDGSPVRVQANATPQKISGGDILWNGVAIDITGQKQVEQTLQESQEKYRQLVEDINDVLFMTNEVGVITYISPAVESLFGYAVSEIVGRHFSTFVHLEDIPLVSEEFKHNLAGDLHPSEYRIITKAGGVRWVRTSSRPFYRDGEVAGARGLLTDITGRKTAEAALRESEEKYRLLLETAGVGVGYYTVEGAALLFNQTAAAYLGGKPEDFVGKSMADLFDPPAAATYMARIEQAITSSGSQQYQDCVPVASGQKWFLSTYTAVRDDYGDVAGVQIISNDITECKQIELALQKSNEQDRFQAMLLDQIQDLIVATDLEGRITYVNRGDARKLGLSKEALVGQSVHSFGENSDQGATQQEIIDQALAEGSWQGQVVNYDRDGEEIVMESRVWVISDEQGEPTGMVGVSTDITRRKQAEAQLKASLDEKEVLLREIHHRVKNSLTVVSSLLEFQADRIEDETMRAALAGSRHRIYAMARIYELLYRANNLVWIDMAEYTRSLADYLQQAHSAYHILINVDVAQGMVLDIDHAIPCGLIINELLSNALQHAFIQKTSADPPTVQIALASSKETTCTLVVKDNGIGLPPDVDEQLDATLGLQLAELLAQQLQGTLSLESNDSGTTVKICFDQ